MKLHWIFGVCSWWHEDWHNVLSMQISSNTIAWSFKFNLVKGNKRQQKIEPTRDEKEAIKKWPTQPNEKKWKLLAKKVLNLIEILLEKKNFCMDAAKWYDFVCRSRYGVKSLEGKLWNNFEFYEWISVTINFNFKSDPYWSMDAPNIWILNFNFLKKSTFLNEMHVLTNKEKPFLPRIIIGSNE